MLRVQIASVGLDPRSQHPVILLKAVEGDSPNYDDRIMPITLGHPEATAIITALQGVRFPRPMTHDLMAAMLDSADLVVERVEIEDFARGTFFASIVISQNDSSFTLDARPSDAIALALRLNTPIFVDERIFIKASLPIGAVHMDGPSAFGVDEEGNLKRLSGGGTDESAYPGDVRDYVRMMKQFAESMGFNVTAFHPGDPNNPIEFGDASNQVKPKDPVEVERELSEFREFIDNILPEDFQTH